MALELGAGRIRKGAARRARMAYRTVGFWLVVAGLLFIRPIAKVRLATFRSERLGHFVSDTDLALALLPHHDSLSTRRTLFVFVMPVEACNEQVRAMYIRALKGVSAARILDCRQSRLGRLLLEPARRLTKYVQTDWGWSELFCGSPDPAGIDAVGLKPSGRPFLRHEQSERLQARRALDRLGIPAGVPYACIHIRDTAYLNKFFKHRNWDYHNYRNPPLESYLPAIQSLLDRGMAVVRMGRASSGDLGVQHPLYFDYSRWDGRSDLLDTFLYSEATLAVGGGASGVDTLACAFNVPYVCTNFVPFEDPRFAVDLSITIPSMIRDSQSGQLLPLSRMLVSRFFNTKEYTEAGLLIEYNTADEITEAVQEAVRRIDHEWSSGDEDVELQAQFWEWADRQGMVGRLRPGPWDTNHYRSHLGTSFLRKYADALLS